MFPTTRSSAVADLLSGDPQRQARSIEVIAEAYWKPAHAYLRLRWRATPEHADDLTQSFFEVAVRRDLFVNYQPGRGRFRTYLRACLDRHAVDQHRHASAARRGSGVPAVDLEDVEHALAGADPDALFEAEWLRHLMQLAIDRLDTRLTTNNKPVHAALFRAFHIGDPPPTYAEIAALHHISVTDVTNWLSVARKEFRKVALELLRELTLDDEDFAGEALAVFGIDIAR
jgi:RNA polymerase sigma factor (sigma-70 family)